MDGPQKLASSWELGKGPGLLSKWLWLCQCRRAQGAVSAPGVPRAGGLHVGVGGSYRGRCTANFSCRGGSRRTRE